MKNDNEEHFRDEMICFWWFWHFNAAVKVTIKRPRNSRPFLGNIHHLLP